MYAMEKYRVYDAGIMVGCSGLGFRVLILHAVSKVVSLAGPTSGAESRSQLLSNFYLKATENMEPLRTDNMKSFSSPEFPFQLPFAARSSA